MAYIAVLLLVAASALIAVTSLLSKPLGLTLGDVSGLHPLQVSTHLFQPAGIFALAAAGLMGMEAMFIKRLSDTEPATLILLINNSLGAS